MGRSIRIGRIKGVPIRVHWSFPLLLVLVFVPSAGSDRASAIAAGLAWIAVLFACIVVHELSHCFVARRRGFVVRDIVLLPIGGASEIEGLPGPPPDELAIAIAGPLASVALAGGFALLGLAAGSKLWPPSLFTGSLATRLLWANLLLAAFNLVPAIPMDGGRVLRALLARSHSDLHATVLAVRVGRVVGFAMVLVGLRFDPWLSVIGVFVLFGGSGEARAAAVRTATGGLSVADVMVHDSTTLEVSFPLAVVGPFLEATPGRVVPVVERGQYVGLISADLLGAAAQGPLLRDAAIDRLTPPLSPRDRIYPLAVTTLLAGQRRAAAVLVDGAVVGVLYSAHLEAALRRATTLPGATSISR